MNFTTLFIVITVVLVVLYVYISIYIIKKKNKEIIDAKISIQELTDENNLLAVELKNLHHSMKKKQEVENETKQNLANIASGTTDDSVDRLQHPEKRRKTKSSNRSKNNSSGV